MRWPWSREATPPPTVSPEDVILAAMEDELQQLLADEEARLRREIEDELRPYRRLLAIERTRCPECGTTRCSTLNGLKQHRLAKHGVTDE